MSLCPCRARTSEWVSSSMIFDPINGRLGRLGWSCAIALFAALGVACEAASPPRLIILYATCTVNRDFLAPYNDGVEFTPNLDRFAGEAAVFSNHRTETGISGPSFASIYSGTQADRHGVFKHPKKLGDDLYLIFEAFADAGYDPYYWTAHVMSRPGLNYAQGVEKANTIRAPLTGDDERFRELLARLDEDEDYRALVVTSFSVTHGPWDLEQTEPFRESFPSEAEGVTPEEVRRYHDLFRANHIPFQTRFAKTVERLRLTPTDVDRLARVLAFIYQSKINLLDSYFGGVVQAVDDAGLADTSVIAFTADHGQTLYEEGRRFNWTHAPDLAPEVIDVPLLIRGPKNLVPARRVDAVSRSIDVYPTLAGLAGIAVPMEKGVVGVDLSASLRGEAPDISIRSGASRCVGSMRRGRGRSCRPRSPSTRPPRGTCGPIGRAWWIRITVAIPRPRRARNARR